MSNAPPDTAQTASGSSAGGITAPRWIIEHDDRWLWTILYISSAVLLSIFISLFWLIIVVMVHAVLEVIRQRHFDRRTTGVVSRMLWEIKLDIALVFFAIAVALYTDVILGAAGLGGAARTGAQLAARGGAWAKAIRGVLLSVDDAAQLARAVIGRPGGDSPSDEPHLEGPAYWGGWTRRWGAGGWIAVSLTVASSALIGAAPLLTDHAPPAIVELLMHELHPWPSLLQGEVEPPT